MNKQIIKQVLTEVQIQKIEGMDSIERVDNIVKQNNIKYIIQKQQEEYEEQLEKFKKKNKQESLKLYTEKIKQANKRAIEKAKLEKKHLQAKKKKAKKNREQYKNQLFEKESLLKSQQQNNRNRMNVQEIRKVEQAIETRATKILQQKQLVKLEKTLVEERKKTKLHELNQKCRKLVKSQAKLPATSDAIPDDRKKILEEFQKKALEEIGQLDHIIEGIVEGKKIEPQRPKTQEKYRFKELKAPIQQNDENSLEEEQFVQSDGSASIEQDLHKKYLEFLQPPQEHFHEKINEAQEQQGYQESQINPKLRQLIEKKKALEMDDPLFSKSTEYLLSLPYFHI